MAKIILNYRAIIELKNNDYKHFNICYNFLLDMLELIKNADYKSDESNYVRAVTDKFIKMSRELGAQGPLLNELDNISQQFVGNVLSNVAISTQTNSYQAFITRIAQIKTDIKSLVEKSNDFVMPEIIDPNYSDKDRVAELINQAIEIISNSNSIKPDKIKKLIDFLQNAINELNKDRPNWTNYFGEISQTLYVLAALANILVGISEGYDLMKAKEKLEEANKTILVTSMNLTPVNIHNVFILDRSQIIVKDNQLMLKKPDNE